MNKNSIFIVAPSSPAPAIELELGIEKLVSAGFEVQSNVPSPEDADRFFSGDDSSRFEKFIEAATDADSGVVWFSRGGYGASRILPLLEDWSKSNPKPARKLLVGFSDATALFDFVQSRWGWSVLHAPMPATQGFHGLSNEEWQLLVALVRGDSSAANKLWGNLSGLEFHGAKSSFKAMLIGGNLSVYSNLIGTPYLNSVSGAVLFLEDVGEPLGRLDRMVRHVALSSAFKDSVAIAIGEFSQCRDSAPEVLAERPAGAGVIDSRKAFDGLRRKPLRVLVNEDEALKQTFQEVADQASIPLISGIPAGHGDRQHPLPLYAEYQFDPIVGTMVLSKWNWLDSSN